MICEKNIDKAVNYLLINGTEGLKDINISTE